MLGKACFFYRKVQTTVPLGFRYLCTALKCYPFINKWLSVVFEYVAVMLIVKCFRKAIIPDILSHF